MRRWCYASTCVFADRSRDYVFHRGLPFRPIKTDSSFRQEFALTAVGLGLGRLCPEFRSRKGHETAMATPTSAGNHLTLAEQELVGKSIRQDDVTPMDAWRSVGRGLERRGEYPIHKSAVYRYSAGGTHLRGEDGEAWSQSNSVLCRCQEVGAHAPPLDRRGRQFMARYARIRCARVGIRGPRSSTWHRRCLARARGPIPYTAGKGALRRLRDWGKVVELG